MSLIPVEKSFPRGGLKEFSTHQRPSFQSPSLFRVKKPRHIPRNNFNHDHPEKTKDYNGRQQNGDDFLRLKKFTGQLTYKSVSDGMLSLGAIFAINELEMKVALPGNTIGTVPITNISETYTTALRNALVSHSKERIASLREMYKIGQHVVAKVVGKVLQNNRTKITLSLDPQVIYSGINLEEVCKGSIVIASVKSIEDKGYVMAVGKSSIRAFLSNDQSSNYEAAWNGGKKLGLGQVVRCYVKKATTLDSTTTLVLTVDPAKVAKANYDKTGSTCESLMPGMKFTATVSNLFTSGIQIQLSDNFIGYVYRDHFEAPFKTPENYEIGMSVKAQLLYILPSGAVYFTLKTSILEANPPTDPYSVLKCGEIINEAKVFSTSDLGLIVKVGKDGNSALKGFVPLNQTSHKSPHEIDDFDMPVSQQLAMEFPIHSDVTCRIMDYNYMELYYVCTMDKELMNEKIINPVLLEVGMVVPCTIQSIQLKGIVLNMGKGCRVTGFVPLTHISDVLLSNPEKKYHIGQKCTARVLSLKDGKFIFTLKRLQVQSKDPILSSFEDAALGDVYTGSVQQINEHGLLIQFFNFVSGWLPTKYLGSDTSRTNITSKYDLGQLVPCKIVKIDETQRKLELALRDFEMPIANGKKKKEKKRNAIDNCNDTDTQKHLSAWAVPEVEATPKVISKKHAKKLAKLAAEAEKDQTSSESVPLKGAAQKRKASQSEVETENDSEPPSKKEKAISDDNTEVTGLSKRAAKRLRAAERKAQSEQKNEDIVEAPSAVSKKAAKKLAKELEQERKNKECTSELAKNPKVKQKAASGLEEEEGVKINPALSKKAEKKLKALAKEKEQEIKESMEKNPELTKNPKKKKGAAANSVEVQNEIEEITPALSKKDAKKQKTIEKEQKRKGMKDDPIATEIPAKKRKNDESELDSKQKKPKTTTESRKPKEEVHLPSLAVPNGFFWDATPNLLPVVAGNQDEPDSSDDEEQTTTMAKKTRQVVQNEKRIQAQQEEARLRKIEQRLMDEDAPPQSADEFDRLVLSSPDSSIVWLQYMAHHLQATEIEKAKNVGLRALRTISFREDQERLNVWGALLNLENLYGTKESLETTLEEAIKNNDDYEVHSRMLSIYGESGKFEEGDKLISSMVKKFKYNKDMWYNAAVFYMRSSQMEKARALLNRALTFLTKSEHVATITRFALLENKLGSKERAQTLMEQVLTSYPKRVDIWGTYVDMLVKSKLISMARQVLERGVCQRLPSHKMKTLFKKFLAFEQAHGTEEDTQKVRLMALKYVESFSTDV